MRPCVTGRSVMVALLIAGAGLAPTGCTTNAATGDKILALGVSPEQEAQIGAQAAPELAQEFGGPVQNAQLQQYVTNIGKKLAAETEDNYPSLQWEFTLLDSPIVNAFSLPGGKVFITRGLAEKMTNEAQMAGVLGHEIGHVTAQHVVRRMSQQNLLSIALAGAGVAAGAASDTSNGLIKYGVPALSVAGSTMLLKFSRDEESQADSLGMRYMTKAGYNPEAQLQVMQILEQASQGAGGLEMLQTHPLPQTRIQRLQSELQQSYANVVNNPNYQYYPERFQQQFLSIAKTLPPPKQPQQAPTGGTPKAGGQATQGGRQPSGLQSSPSQQRISRPAR